MEYMTIKKAKKQTKGLVKLNLGCGNVLLDGFINVDKFTMTHKGKKNFVEADIMNLPFESNYADYILMDNVLEHFPIADVPQVLMECRRVLKPGGRLVVFVPDFTDMVQMWNEILTTAFNPYNYLWVAELVYGNQMNGGEFHKVPMYPGFLNYAFHIAGLHKFIMIGCPRGGKCPTGFEGINHDPRSVLRVGMILVEATK